ncbi:MAG: hypothetical protein NZ825_12775 [Candidatus Marinimicrobia bacterium]|nr:hypothetical protein [Candidatus Neomarinimicrobiota bacterium]
MYYKDYTTRDWSIAQSVTNLNSDNEWESQLLYSKEKGGMPPQKPKMINNKQVFIIGNGESRIGFDLEQLRDYGKIYGCNLLCDEFTPDALVAIDERVMHPIYWSGYPLDNVCWFRDWGSPMPGEAYEALTDSSMITGDPTVEMSDYLYSNSRNDSTEFVMHGTNKDVAEGFEKEVRENDKNKVLDESAIQLVFKSGIYTTWLNKNGDKVKDLGGGSFAPELQAKHPEVYQQFKANGPYSSVDRGQDYIPTLAMNCGPTAQLTASLVENPDEIYLLGMDIYSNNDRVNNVYKGKQGYMTVTGNAMPGENFILQHRDMFKLFPHIKFFKVNKFPLGTDNINREVPEWKDTPNLEYLTYAEMFRRLANHGEIT